MKIAQLISVYLPVVGGAQICVHNVAQRLESRGHSTTLIVPWQQRKYKTGSYSKAALWPGTVFLLKRWYGLGKFYLLFQIRRVQKRHGFDLWQVTVGYPLGTAAVDYFQKHHIPCVLCCTGDDIQVDPAIGYGMRLDLRIDRLIRSQYPKFDALVGYASTVLDEYRKLSVSDKKLALIPNGVDLMRFQAGESKGSLREKLRLPQDKKILVSVGRNHPKKGFDSIPRMIGELAKTRNDFLWIVAGDGNKALVPQDRKQGWTHYFTVTDPIPEHKASGRWPPDFLVDLYKAADVFVFPTFVETFGIVVVEAMAAGLPVVTTTASGVDELIEHEQTGLKSAPGDWAGMVQNIERLLSDDKFYRAIQSRVQSKSREYDWDKVAGRYLELYKRLAER